MKRSLILLVAASLASMTGLAEVPAGSEREIAERIAPEGSLCRASGSCAGAMLAEGGAPAAAGSRSGRGGQAVYDAACHICHAAGVGGAPLLGDAGAWAGRADKGMDELMSVTLNGVNAMPPRGACMDCSDGELQNAVQYMLDQL